MRNTSFVIDLTLSNGVLARAPLRRSSAMCTTIALPELDTIEPRLGVRSDSAAGLGAAAGLHRCAVLLRCQDILLHLLKDFNNVDCPRSRLHMKR
jgi:hypothetical protein